ncbi:MAG: F0F1 ATP synthase subunit A [Odoribacteraceae bacterium]|jgi:F-type H+-transporting ATPase subunit a|nr:F0F1 ATP synthase subunit A [Odoribacteraceae bacterium]
MRKRVLYIVAFLGLLLCTPTRGFARGEEEPGKFNLREVIFTHLGDEYSWELPGGAAIHLPVIVRDREGQWHCFSSSRLNDGAEHEGFYLAREGDRARKVVARDQEGNEYRPLDFSITKNVVAIGIGSLLTALVALTLARYYKRKRFKAPRKGVGFIESLVEMVYTEVVVEVLEKDARRFGPYLLTLFFFILLSNLLGMIVIFPGGANVTGNISVTLALALCTFVLVNVSGKKHYWRETFWPDVPLWLKFPIPLMPLIEVFSVLTKPIALMIRLFANMLGGHLIALILVSLIFLLGALGSAVMGGTIVISILFSLFMNVLHLLIAFIQAYVFMMLSTIFIRLARE